MLRIALRFTTLGLLLMICLIIAVGGLGVLNPSTPMLVSLRNRTISLDTRTGITTPYQSTVTNYSDALISPDGRWQLRSSRPNSTSSTLILTDLDRNTSYELGSYSVLSLNPFSIIWQDNTVWVMAIEFNTPIIETLLLQFDLERVQPLQEYRYRISPQSWMPSPNGQYMLMLGQQRAFPYQRAMVIDLATGEDVMNGVDVFSPRWSPDGNWLFAEIEVNGQRVVQWLNVGNREILQTPKAGRRSLNVSWSPDSRYTVYENMANGEPTLNLMSLETGTETVLLSSSEYLLSLWSPNGTRLLIIEQTATETRLNVTQDDHTDMTVIDRVQGSVVSPIWSADEQRIAYIVNEDNRAFIRLIDLESGQARDVLHLPQTIFRIDWQRDG